MQVRRAVLTHMVSDEMPKSLLQCFDAAAAAAAAADADADGDDDDAKRFHFHNVFIDEVKVSKPPL